MISDDIIIKSIPLALKTLDVPELGPKTQGKVRDIYFKDDKRIMITTDRQSAFDVVLGQIPYKGAVLNQLSKFWFEKTGDIVDNHMISLPDPNVLVAKNCKGIPVEMIVRGYMTGVTDTSIWHSYEKGDREIYGIQFPDGIKKNQKLHQPVITPTTHGEAGTHDERLTHDMIVEKGIVEKELYEQMEKAALELFKFGQEWCEKQGIILVDTKYEFGLVDGKLTLMDEIHTPDSSRFWIAETYEDRFNRGEEPEQYSKEFLRMWYVNHGYKGEGTPPPMPADLALKMAKLYIGIYEKITGTTFEAFEYPIEERIRQNLKTVS